MTKIIIAGGRKFNDRALMIKALNEVGEKLNLEAADITIVCGMAEGADLLGYSLAKENGIACIEFPADWQDMSEPCVVKTNKRGTYNALAGMKRNHAMGDHADILIAFWDGKSSGTLDMINYMFSLEKPIYTYRY